MTKQLDLILLRVQLIKLLKLFIDGKPLHRDVESAKSIVNEHFTLMEWDLVLPKDVRDGITTLGMIVFQKKESSTPSKPEIKKCVMALETHLPKNA